MKDVKLSYFKSLKLVGYGFSLPSNENKQKIKLKKLKEVGLDGRLKPYPTANIITIPTL